MDKDKKKKKEKSEKDLRIYTYAILKNKGFVSKNRLKLPIIICVLFLQIGL